MLPLQGIFPASVGLDINYLAFIFVLSTVLTIVGFIFVFWSTRHPMEGSNHFLAKYEKHWTVMILIILIAFSVTTLPFLPYPYAHSSITPNKVMDVQAQQFFWCLMNGPLPQSQWGGTNCIGGVPKITSGLTVLFNVTSIDVTHDFAVYKCSDSSCATASLQMQVQVMPGFYNQIMYQFTTPGIYYIRCLEFCGFGHYAMIAELNVTSS